MAVSQNIQRVTIYDSAIPLLGIYPKELKQRLSYLYTHVHSGIIHNSQKVGETLHNQWMNG